ncbi:carbon starvation CstA family protein [Shigella flexneri]
MLTATVERRSVPFLFITIACGAVSGFHALISSVQRGTAG